MKYCISSSIGYAWRDKVDEVKLTENEIKNGYQFVFANHFPTCQSHIFRIQNLHLPIV